MVNATFNKFGKKLPPVKTGQRFGEEVKKDKKVGLFSERRFLIFTKKGPIEIAFKPVHYTSVLITTIIGLTSIIYWSAKGIYSAIDVAKKNDIITEASANINVSIENDSDTNVNFNVEDQSNITLPILKKTRVDVDNIDVYKAIKSENLNKKTFIQENLVFKARKKTVFGPRDIQRWYKAWRSAEGHIVAADDAHPRPSERSLLKSRAPKQHAVRKRDAGAGRPFAAPLVRQALYEWFASIRYAIDWKQLIAENRSRGKKHLARFPRSLLKLKVQELLREHAYACLLNGQPVRSFQSNSWWFKRWEEEYGLSMRCANRKYKVPRWVLKERLELFWVNLFRIRIFINLKFGKEPLILNFDQPPFITTRRGVRTRLLWVFEATQCQLSKAVQM